MVSAVTGKADSQNFSMAAHQREHTLGMGSVVLKRPLRFGAKTFEMQDGKKNVPSKT